MPLRTGSEKVEAVPISVSDAVSSGFAIQFKRGSSLSLVLMTGMRRNSAAIVAMVAAGGGIGLVPDFAAQGALDDGRVVPVLPGWQLAEPYTGAVHFVDTPGRHVALKIRAFIDYFVAAAQRG